MQNTTDILFFLFPQYCILCGTKCKTNRLLCSDCDKELPRIKAACTKCGQELHETVNDQLICGICLKKQQEDFTLIVPFKYQYPIDHFIKKLKFNHNLAYARLLGSLLAKHLHAYYSARQKPKLIIPIPLHKKRLRERGFNQALEIAKIVAKNLGIPIDRYSCKRYKNTAPQSKLPIAEREKNIKNSFSIKKSLLHQHVAVIDDVITTGNTIDEFCKVLLKNGAKKIDVWCCSKTHLATKYVSIQRQLVTGVKRQL